MTYVSNDVILQTVLSFDIIHLCNILLSFFLFFPTKKLKMLIPITMFQRNF